ARLNSCREMLRLLDGVDRDAIVSRANTIVRTLKEAATARQFVTHILTVDEVLRRQREKTVALEHKYNNKNAKRLGEIIDLSNLPPVHEDFVGAAGTLLGIAGSSLAHAYGINPSPLRSIYRSFRKKRARPRMTTPKQPHAPVYAHPQQWDEFLR